MYCCKELDAGAVPAKSTRTTNAVFNMSENKTFENNLDTIKEWRRNVFKFTEDALNMKPSLPIDELRGKPIRYVDEQGVARTTMLFDNDGILVYPDLSFYKMKMFKNQTKGAFKKYKKTRFTWQQTVELEAYNRAINTFDKDSYDRAKRWITIVSGHGVGKTSFLSVISLHFIISFFGAQIGATANTENQLKDIFLKELWYWREKLPAEFKNNIQQLDDFVRIVGEKDWFMRARVASDDKPEALAGLHGEYVLLFVDEASGVKDKTFEVMKGALTGENFIVIYTGNPTRNEGAFRDSQKEGMAMTYTQLHFNSRQSPIVKDGYIQQMEADYPSTYCHSKETEWKEPCNKQCVHSDEVKIRVDGEFAGTTEMDDKGWIPLFANVNILFEEEKGQIINRAIIGVDPAGKGRDRSIIDVRDAVYLKEVLNEKTSSEPDLARKVEMIKEIYNSATSDIAVDAFGIGAKVVANIHTKMGESVNALLTDKPRDEVKHLYNSFKTELGWRFRTWCANGGIIVTNNKAGWVKELEKIKYKRNERGVMMLMPKAMFKKEYGFSPDRFDASCMTFFKDEPTAPVILSKEQLETKENQEWLQRQRAGQRKPSDKSLSTM